MSGAEEAAGEELPLESVGQRLRRKREEMGLGIAQVASETRIPEHHLVTIESGDFSALPAKTYAVGFSRSYARLVGLDEMAIADEVRAELAAAEDARQARQNAFEPGDPGKLPSSGLAWAGGFAALILAIGAFSFYSTFYGAGNGPAPLQPDPEPVLATNEASSATGEAAVQQGAVSGDGQVVFTALEDGIWVKFYDAQGERLLEKQMASGERFEIPSDAQGPQIWTGRPDAFAITINGRAVPKLAEDDFVMRDVAISAEALLARNEAEGSLPDAINQAMPNPAPEAQLN
ncbi:helix-turn-helix domain-containing protein [Altererythrobacter sp. GH1-8]|uniref:helix-turn-helix domain-containing protein n=1 Tax=Altererythrobacter sp. GH1-8 TaxID=3349333 RepID=UPI00374D7D82